MVIAIRARISCADWTASLRATTPEKPRADPLEAAKSFAQEDDMTVVCISRVAPKEIKS